MGRSTFENAHMVAERPIQTLGDLLRHRRSSDHGYSFVHPDGSIQHLGFQAAYFQANAAARSLDEQSLRGQRLLLLYPPSLDYVVGLFATWLCGAVAVPVYPPDPRRAGSTMARLRQIAVDSQASAILTTSWLAHELGQGAAELFGDLPLIPTDTTEVFAENLTVENLHPGVGDEPCLIQYTSGSTSTPKGVVLSHSNLLSNSDTIAHAFGCDSSSRALSWLPMYHDMGLIGGVLQPLYSDFDILLTSPMSFLSAPLEWLERISDHRITISGGPNFAFALTARRFRPDAWQNRRIDLSAWQVAFNGAEPIDPATLDHFTRIFSPYGFDPASFATCYGLAEATLMVTCNDSATPPRVLNCDRDALTAKGSARLVDPGPDATAVVSSGRPQPTVSVAVLNSSDMPAPGDEVGHIAVAGPAVTSAYWGDSAATRSSTVSVCGTSMIRTGDVGFMHDGELFVLGRGSEMINIRGRNIAPTDVERAIESSVTGIRKGCVAAVEGRHEGESTINVVAEVIDPSMGVAETQAVLADIRAIVSSEHGAPAGLVALVEPRTLPKTSSGKIKRVECKQILEYDELSLVAKSSPRAIASGPARDSARPDSLLTAIARLTGTDPSRIEDDIAMSRLGLDSVRTVELVALLNDGRPEQAIDPLDILARDLTVGDLRGMLEASRPDQPHAPPDRVGPTSDQRLAATKLGLWTHARRHPGGSAYHLARAFELPRALDLDQLEAKLRTLVTAHPTLRRIYTLDSDGYPVGELQPTPERVLHRIHRPPGPVDRSAIRDVITSPFDLTKDLPFRFTILLGQPRVLVAVFHHIATDLAGLDVLIRELCDLYSTDATARDDTRRRPSIAQSASPTQLEASRGYWQHQLQRPPQPLRLPGHKDTSSTRSDEFTTPLSDHDLKELTRLADSLGITPFVATLALYTAALHRASSATDLCVGTPVHLGALTDPVEYNLNVLPLRIRPASPASFATLAKQCRRTLAEALSHRHLPLADITEMCSVRDTLNVQPLFNVMITAEGVTSGSPLEHVALGNRDEATLVLGETTLRQLAIPPVESLFDLTLRIAPAEWSWQFRADVLERRTVEILARETISLLHSFASDPTIPIGAVPFNPSPPHTELAHVDNEPKTVLQVITEVARRHPNSPAIQVGQGDVLTYSNLTERVDRLAAKLQQIGVTVEQPVAFAASSTPDAIIALLAILRSGGCLVSIDPESPPDVLVELISNSDATVVLTEHAHRESIGFRLPGIQTYDLALSELTDDPPEPLDVKSDPSTLAYMLYTSGSTGSPKAVMVSHGALAASTSARHEYFGDVVDRFLLISRLSFDSSMAGLFRTLTEGGCVVLPKPTRSHDPAHHLELLQTCRISHFESVPPLYQVLLRLLQHEGGTLPHLKSVVVAGESCPAQLLRTHQRLLPQVRFVNEYGPTETTVWCTAFTAAAHDLADGSAPIGKAVPGATIHLLDLDLKPVPDGATGEVFVGGSMVGRGYYKEPAATAAAFLPDPYSRHAGARMYRTGDLAWANADGDLIFAGRVDDQLKLRGYRIEPAVIRDALSHCAGVNDAAVVLKDTDDAPQLVAYLVADKPSDLVLRELRSHLHSVLPAHQVPSIFCTVESLPLTRNGKLDKDALPDPAETAIRESVVAPPRDLHEHAVVDAYAAVVGLPTVGRDDNFFAIGGSSLQAMQVAARIRATLGVDVSDGELFQTPVAADLAARLRNFAERTKDDGRPELRALHDPANAPASPAQTRLWFIDQVVPGSAAYNIPVAVRLRGALDADLLANCLNHVYQRHEALRTVFPAVTGAPKPALLETDLRLEVADAKDFEAALQHSRQLAAEPFDLAVGPMLRANLDRLAPDDHVLTLVTHHIVADGWSLGVLTDEISLLYSAGIAGSTAHLPELPVQFSDVARWLHDLADSTRQSQSVQWWVDELAGAPDGRMPTDRPRQSVQTFNGQTTHWQLSHEQTQRLRHLAKATDTTLFIVTLTAFALLLRRLSYLEDVVIGTAVSGRSHPDTENMIGFFANTLPLRLNLSSAPTVMELVTRIRDRVVDALHHSDAPLEAIIEHTQASRDLGRNPLFQVAFAYQNAPRPPVRLENLHAEVLDVISQTAKFDLTVSAWEEGSTLHGSLEWNIDLFDRTTIELWQRRLLVLMSSMADNWTRSIDDVVWAESDPQRMEPTQSDGLVAFDITGRPLQQKTIGQLYFATDGNLLSSGELSQLSPTGEFQTLGPVVADDNESRVAEVAYQPPVTATEEVILHIWKDNLGRYGVNQQQIGIYDDFFSLGGHSLLVTRIAADLEAVFQRPLAIQDFFLEPTISGAATVITNAERSPGQTERIARIWLEIHSFDDDGAGND